MMLRDFKFQKNRSGAISQSMMLRLTPVLEGAELMDLANVLQTEPDLSDRDRVIINSAVKALFVTKAIWPEVSSS
jgi:hypothetical protein